MPATIIKPQDRHRNNLKSSKKHRKLTEVTYLNNKDSNYTEKIEALDSQFNYQDHQDYYWGPPELSVLYGTSLYEQASTTQKLALNHLYWATQYNQTAATEANAILYNQVTEGVFSTLGGYRTLCEELSLETAQEHHHIHAFHSVGYKTKKALFGVKNRKINKKLGSNHRSKGLKTSSSFPLSKFLDYDWQKIQEDTFCSISTRLLQKNQSQIYSSYLKKLETEGEPFPIQTTGLLGQVVPRSLSKSMTVNFGSSPFLACLFYVTRYLANILLKNYEYRYSQYYRTLAKTGEFIPIPTAISHNHLLDESFHTTISQLIAQDLYKDFAQPTVYEKSVANLILYRGQILMLGGLSGVMPVTFRSDEAFIPSLYQILTSSMFSMSHEEALHWLEESLTREHDGFHLNLQCHERMLNDMRRAFEPLDYLWSVNRDVKVMASGNSLKTNLKKNHHSFLQFKKTFEGN